MYQLPDGQEIQLRSQCFGGPEPLFQPCLIGSEEGLPTVIREHLSSNIVLAGGSTMFPGMAERLCAELSMLSQGERRVNVRAPPERRLSSWIGGSILASRDEFDKICLSKDAMMSTDHKLYIEHSFSSSCCYY